MSLAEQIESTQRLIRQLEASCHRQLGSVELLAVTKTQNVETIKLAFAAGLHSFGESYLQEALVKIQALATLPLCWHFIGAIQSNKTHAIAQHFSWVHGVDRAKIAQLLNKDRPAFLPPLNVCIQVNIDAEATKSGIKPERVAALCADIIRLPSLQLRGLMVIPKPTINEHQQYITFLTASILMQQVNAELNLHMDTLSMGMSDDLPAAIRAGSTMVRVGRTIFGERSSRIV